MNRLFIIDGHSLIFRMYYAFMRRPMINSKGEDTSILFGFTKYLLELIRNEQPTHLAVAFDPPAKTFRHELYPEYKANRSAAPELVKAALEPLTEIVKALDIPVVMCPGYEADDVIGSLATQAASRGFDVYMVTPDKDLGQIIGEHVFQYKPGKSGSENEVWDRAKLCEAYGISDPKQIIDILTVWGDSADNIKGVDGIGEVGAKKLVGKYGSVDGIYAHLDELSAKQQEKFRAAEEHIDLSRTLATIRTDIDPGVSDEDLILNARATQKVRDLFNYYEFNSLRSLLPEGGEAPEMTEPLSVRLEPRETPADALMAKAEEAGRVAVRIEGGVAVLAVGEDYCRVTLKQAEGILSNPFIDKVGFGLKHAAVLGDVYDIEIMHYLLNPERGHKLPQLARTYINVDLEAAEEATPDLFSVQDGSAAPRECVAAGLIEPHLRKELQESGMWELYTGIEMPLIPVLADMEATGVRIDPQQLYEYRSQLAVQMNAIEAKARAIAGDPQLNLSSPKQVGAVIYEKLCLDTKVRKSRTGSYPTDEETLAALPVKHEFVDNLLEYRGLKKLISTYLDPLPSLMDSEGRVHTTYNQALTATGRLSSSKPNLQNIPVRTEQGREIRKAFVPSSPDGFILAADYSQIELRLMAELSRDPALLEGFRNGADIHADTASRIFHTPLEEVTKEQRRQAKVANFGIIYGISAFGLAQRMDIPRSEARNFIEQYFIHYPKVKEYMDSAIAGAKETGCVMTAFGRKRYLPDINSRNQVVRSLAERNAINAPIQGSAADIIKKAMINVYKRLNEDGYRSKMVLQVHDELVFDVVPEELERLTEMVRKEMEGVCDLSIPLIVECDYGKNWLEAH